MRMIPANGAGSLLPSAANVNDKKQKSSGTPARPGTAPAAPPPGPPLPPKSPSNLLLLREQAREAVAGMRAYHAPGCYEWPRQFDVPGIGFGRTMSAAEVVSHLCLVLHNCLPELHAMAAENLPARPAEMAELAEVLAIAEEVCCSDGLKTDLDETPAGELSSLGKFAATAKALALLKVPLAQEADK